MPTDQQVSAKAVLHAVMEIRRRGPTQVLQELEQVEPDLTEHLLESLSEVRQKLLALGGPARKSQRLFRDIQSLTLVCIIALRRGHYELWRQSPDGQQVERLDPDEPPSPPDADL